MAPRRRFAGASSHRAPGRAFATRCGGNQARYARLRTGVGSVFVARRQPHQARADPAVTPRYACPHCGEDGHTAAECDARVTHLDGPELHRLRALVLEELGAAMLGGGDRQHLEAVVVVLRGVEARLAREGEGPVPSFGHRQTLAAEARSTHAL